MACVRGDVNTRRNWENCEVYMNEPKARVHIPFKFSQLPGVLASGYVSRKRPFSICFVKEKPSNAP